MVNYNDGTVLTQLDENSKEHKYPEIERNKVNEISIGYIKEINGKNIFFKIHSIGINPNEKFWYRRTSAIELDSISLKENGRKHYYVIGSENNKNVIIDKNGQKISHKALDNYIPNLFEYEVNP